ncbi:uncharacterized protein A4U43_C09F7790 [Asparagus officinalis]|uniref:Uncharacterized protein n=1 Tax=Asparagus officinalis TaxID=4686 RepID=A0A5P1E6H7_ASPOF|nr:uncharacterized protein A4U43_C09F7790 [Asparagus officinalis]
MWLVAAGEISARGRPAVGGSGSAAACAAGSQREERAGLSVLGELGIDETQHAGGALVVSGISSEWPAVGGASSEVLSRAAANSGEVWRRAARRGARRGRCTTLGVAYQSREQLEGMADGGSALRAGGSGSSRRTWKQRGLRLRRGMARGVCGGGSVLCGWLARAELDLGCVATAWVRSLVVDGGARGGLTQSGASA